jgi:transcriptional antiterminator Rof (Rho-off)
LAGDLDPQTREAFNAHAKKVASASEPYWLAVELRACLDDAIIDSVEASRLWHIWAELEDRYELRPEARPEAQDLMRRAASEWLAVQTNAAAREAYLDRWQYDICGYERK